MIARECESCVYLLPPTAKNRCLWVSDLCFELPDKPKHQPVRGTLVKEVADLTRELSRLNAALSMEQLKHKTAEAEKLAAEYERDEARSEVSRLKSEKGSV